MYSVLTGYASCIQYSHMVVGVQSCMHSARAFCLLQCINCVVKKVRCVVISVRI